MFMGNTEPLILRPCRLVQSRCREAEKQKSRMPIPMAEAQSGQEWRGRKRKKAHIEDGGGNYHRGTLESKSITQEKEKTGLARRN